MNNEYKHKSGYLYVSCRAVSAVIIAMVLVLFSYLYCNYVAAASMPVEPEVSVKGVTG